MLLGKVRRGLAKIGQSRGLCPVIAPGATFAVTSRAFRIWESVLRRPVDGAGSGIRIRVSGLRQPGEGTRSFMYRSVPRAHCRRTFGSNELPRPSAGSGCRERLWPAAPVLHVDNELERLAPAVRDFMSGSIVYCIQHEKCALCGKEATFVWGDHMNRKCFNCGDCGRFEITVNALRKLGQERKGIWRSQVAECVRSHRDDPECRFVIDLDRNHELRCSKA